MNHGLHGLHGLREFGACCEINIDCGVTYDQIGMEN